MKTEHYFSALRYTTSPYVTLRINSPLDWGVNSLMLGEYQTHCS